MTWTWLLSLKTIGGIVAIAGTLLAFGYFYREQKAGNTNPIVLIAPLSCDEIAQKIRTDADPSEALIAAALRCGSEETRHTLAAARTARQAHAPLLGAGIGTGLKADLK